jgi:enoyl-[acyl-carrier-protein] reductase (NADH)
MPLLEGKFGIVFGVANQRSIAWAIAQAWARAGAKLAFTYQGERVKESVAELAGEFAHALAMGAVLEDIAGTIHVHPTLGESLGEAALVALSRGLNI